MNGALIVGATGIVGGALADKLVDEGWEVLGLARRPQARDGVRSITADLLDLATVAAALEGERPTHVFLASCLRQATEAENIRINSTIVRNVLDAIQLAGSVQHVALGTGLKHYFGPFDAYDNGVLPQTPFREDQGRLDVPNFYYAQEDEVFRASERNGFTWSVHRPHTIIGEAVGSTMNMGTTLATYATICKEIGRRFRFPGSTAQWVGLTDMTDADHLLWASTIPAAANEALNVVNGDV